MNNPIVAALLGLAASLKPAYYQSGAPRARGNEHTIKHQSGATRRGFVHKIGKSFRPVMRAFHTLDDGSRVAIAPSLYRHLHLKNKERAIYKKMRLEKRKWISA